MMYALTTAWTASETTWSKRIELFQLLTHIDATATHAPQEEAAMEDADLLATIAEVADAECAVMVVDMEVKAVDLEDTEEVTAVDAAEAATIVVVVDAACADHPTEDMVDTAA